MLHRGYRRIPRRARTDFRGRPFACAAHEGADCASAYPGVARIPRHAACARCRDAATLRERAQEGNAAMMAQSRIRGKQRTGIWHTSCIYA